jgi:hypothetical protein
MKDPLSLTDEDYQSMIDDHLKEADDEVHGDWFEAYVVAPIKDAKYEAVDVKDVVEQQTHLMNEQRNNLYQLLTMYTRLFSGKLGVYLPEVIHCGGECSAHHGVDVCQNGYIMDKYSFSCEYISFLSSFLS